MARSDDSWLQDIIAAISNIRSDTDIPWRAIASTRDRIVHEYFRTNMRRIWDVVASDIDELERALRSK